MTNETTAPPICSYCKKHRWCPACGTGHDAGENCEKCGADLRPAPTARQMPPLFAGAKPLTEVLHDECAKVVSVLQQHQMLLARLAGHAHMPFDAILRRVEREGFKGWLDVRLVFDPRSKIVEARVQMMLRRSSEPPRKGWASLWISPEFVELIHKGMAVGERAGNAGDGPDLDIDVAAQQAAKDENAKAEDLQ